MTCYRQGKVEDRHGDSEQFSNVVTKELRVPEQWLETDLDA